MNFIFRVQKQHKPSRLPQVWPIQDSPKTRKHNTKSTEKVEHVAENVDNNYIQHVQQHVPNEHNHWS